MKNFKGTGVMVALTAPYARSSGQGARVGSLFGIAANDVAQGAVGEFKTEGVFTLPKATGVDTGAGQGMPVYWDDVARVCTGVAGSNLFIGHAVATATNDAAAVDVRVVGGEPAPGVISVGSGIPFIMPSSGTVSNTVGNITVSTGLDYVAGPSYTFFPLGALYAASPSGWYYTNWTAATLCVVYADMYTSGVPQIPAAPTPLTTAAGAYTPPTGVDGFGPSYAVPGGFLGENGYVEWNRVVNNPNSANNKGYNMYFGGVLFQGYTQTTNPKAAGQGTLKNRGRVNAQIGVSAAYGDSGNASSLPKLSINTDNTQVLAFAVSIANGADYAIIESHFMRASSVA